jgi:hypothetical protein
VIAFELGPMLDSLYVLDAFGRLRLTPVLAAFAVEKLFPLQVGKG